MAHGWWWKKQGNGSAVHLMWIYSIYWKGKPCIVRGKVGVWTTRLQINIEFYSAWGGEANFKIQSTLQ